MLIIRRAKKEDGKTISNILKELDLYYAGLKLENFWVAKKEKEIIACVQLADYKEFLFLSMLAVIDKEQRKGVASALMRGILKSAEKNIYLYTIIPKFFEKFNFAVTDTHPNNLPAKNHYECEYCQPANCVTMVKYANAS